MADPSQPNSADPNGVPRQVPTERVEPAKNNSGIIVGEVKETSTHTGQPDEYKTAFVKVYQDAGVIGVGMLTLLVLCVLMGFFNMRLLKMYTTLTESRDNLDKARTTALERLSLTMLTLQQNVTTELNGLKNEHVSQQDRLMSLMSDSERKLELLRREEQTLDKISERMLMLEHNVSRIADRG
jgi:hypothetical protein